MAKRLRIKIKELLKENDISLRELSRQTDIGHSSLSHLANQKREKLHREHIEKIIEALNITDMNEIFEADDVEE